MPSFFCSSSSDTPLVSGYNDNTTKNCSTIMAEKNTKGTAPEAAAMAGNLLEITALVIQCVALPRLWPYARTRLGKTSLR